MSNDYYNASGWPVTLSFGASVSGRSEMASIAAAFDKLVALTGNASKFIRVNAGATGQEAVSSTGSGNVVLATGATIATPTITAPTLTGGTINNTPIGGSTPAAGAFTTLAASGTLTPAGLVDISGASAGQVKFPATQNASANVNTLDDYEEGTWTPTLTCVTPGDLTPNYGAREGDYTKIGNRVYVNFRIIAAPTQTTASGQLRITGLPFTCGALDVLTPCAASNFDLAGATGGLPMMGLNAGTSTLNLSLYPLNSGGIALTIAKFTSGTTIIISGSFHYVAA